MKKLLFIFTVVSTSIALASREHEDILKMIQKGADILSHKKPGAELTLDERYAVNWTDFVCGNLEILRLLNRAIDKMEEMEGKSERPSQSKEQSEELKKQCNACDTFNHLLKKFKAETQKPLDS